MDAGIRSVEDGALTGSEADAGKLVRGGAQVLFVIQLVTAQVDCQLAGVDDFDELVVDIDLAIVVEIMAGAREEFADPQDGGECGAAAAAGT